MFGSASSLSALVGTTVGCSKSIHGVAFLCGIITPSLPAQGEQRRLSYFNIDRDNPQYDKKANYQPVDSRISAARADSDGFHA
jgi:hypothetical protein